MSVNSNKMLERVRKLLAKAEGGTTDEERDALVAKAQELMMEHAITEAMLRTTGVAKSSFKPIMKFINIENPFANGKIDLIFGSAEANRCKAVIYKGYRGKNRRVEVFGMEDDVKFVELLYTNLLLQVTTEQARASKDGRSTGAAWQNAFIRSFAWRVTSRLQENTRLNAKKLDF